MKSYKLNPGMIKDKTRKFSRSELMEMSTYKLRNICRKYKIIKAYQSFYDKKKLIDAILKYRGVEESYLIDKAKAEGFERMQEILNENLVTELKSLDKIKIPAKITIYKEVGINKEDMYKVIAENEIEESNALLVNGRNYLCGIFNLKKDKNNDNEYYLVANKENLRLGGLKNKNYSLLFFKKSYSEYLYKSYYADNKLPPMNLEYYKVAIIDFKIKNLEETKEVLCIDFGTSNTTAGAYLDNNYVSSPSNNDILNKKIRINDINFVKFPFITSKEERWIEMTPTIAYVLDCSNPKDIKFLFGHKAKYRMKKNDYTSNASVFQSIKRWVNTYQQKEEVYDELGNIAKITRGEIIKAYINHVIKTAEHQFKCKFKNIHISSPVKLKSQFITMFQEIIPEYNLEVKDLLDEGISVLYNTIAKQIEQRSFYDGEEYKALVIDCGGGTTDLSSCCFRIEEGDISYKVDIKTGFENGDTNFGGNNITYRIMQFMKIVFANYYQNDGAIIDIDKLIDIPSVDLFRYVDELGINNIYEILEERYSEVERIIPTRYKEYENKTSIEYQKVKNNFYFLWEIAENMKKEFFKKTNILRNKFDSTEFRDVDSDLHITSLNKWSISIYKDGFLETINQFPDVVFNIKEITKLIKADIYEIVRKFLEKFYESRELMDYSIIKLTGQSCKIDIFKEALKEFVPGRSIEFKQKQKDDENSLNLKLSCLRGVIKYMKSKKIGDIEVNIENEAPVIPYSISADIFTGREKVIIDTQERINQAKGNISKPISTEEIKFYLKSEEGILKKEYRYENDLSTYQPIMVEEIINEYQDKISQEDTDTIRNGAIKFFLFTDDNNWGFFVLPICRREEQLYVGEKKYFTFEDDLSNLDFFDGLK
ncbi:molecular chaperone [Orenia marismortui]|uniref:Molecular chaperone n=1 Tax=Orenia marismortui TaxID=46469 RepID=A0A4R8HFQ8_9FIRM|nr:molecular chaperone [Orenia marismortui]TDX58976.1 hypothetical protein C7959_102114 [Orenia marismortui]